MYPKLEDCELITSNQYLELHNPKFIAQTRANSEGMYYMIWKAEGVLYKTYNKL